MSSSAMPSAARRLARLVSLGLFCGLAVTASTQTGQAVTPASATTLATTSAPSAAAGEQPNVILMLLDDARIEDMKWLPKTQRLLGTSGLRFVNAIAENPLCCPARGTLLTAQETHNNGVHTNSGYYGAINSFKNPENSLGPWMQKAGYKTAFFGKYLNGYSLGKYGIPKGWNNFNALTTGTYDYEDFTVANNGNPISYTNDYVTTRMTEQMNGAINDYAAGDAPFFLFDSLVAPHKAQVNGSKIQTAPIPEKKYANLYPNAVNPAIAKPSFNEPDMSDKPKVMQRWEKRTKAETQEHYLGRIRTLASVDDHVESVVNTLRATGELDNTVIIFTSDNGISLGEHRLMYKKWAFKEHLRIPLVISGPGFNPGETTQRWVTQSDIAATMIDVADLVPGRVIDGKSFLGASAADPNRARPILVESGEETAKTATDPKWAYRGVLFGRYTYTKHPMEGGLEQLYDTVNDPHQIQSKHKDPRYSEVLKMMRGYYNRLVDCAGVNQCTLPTADQIQPRK